MYPAKRVNAQLRWREPMLSLLSSLLMLRKTFSIIRGIRIAPQSMRGFLETHMPIVVTSIKQIYRIPASPSPGGTSSSTASASATGSGSG